MAGSARPATGRCPCERGLPIAPPSGAIPADCVEEHDRRLLTRGFEIQDVSAREIPCRQRPARPRRIARRYLIAHTAHSGVCLLLLNGGPDPGRRRFTRVVAEGLRGPSERALNAGSKVGIAAIEDLGEEVVQQRDELRWHLLFGKQRRELLWRDLRVTNLSAGRSSDLFNRFRKRQQLRTSQLIELTHVAIVDKRGSGDIRDVLSVDERLRHLPHWERDFAVQQLTEKEPFTEVLTEP